MSLKIVFMGTPEFSVPTLESLINNKFEILSIYTQPPKKSKRGQKINISPIQKFSEKNNLPVRNPENLNNNEEYNFIKSLSADIAVVVAYGKLIPKNILNRKKRGFTPPIINWLNRSLTDLESKYLSEQQIRERKLIDYEYVKKLSEGYKNGKTSNYVKIWSLICLESWFQSFFKKYKIQM